MGFGSDGLLAETSCTHAHLGFHERLKLLIACWKISFMYHAFSGHRAWMAGSTNASSQNWWSEAKKCVSCRDSLLVNPSRYFDLSSRKPNDEAVIGKACARFNNLARGIDYAIISYISREVTMFQGCLETWVLNESWALLPKMTSHKVTQGESLQAIAAQLLEWPSGSNIRSFIGSTLEFRLSKGIEQSFLPPQSSIYCRIVRILIWFLGQQAFNTLHKFAHPSSFLCAQRLTW